MFTNESKMKEAIINDITSIIKMLEQEFGDKGIVYVGEEIDVYTGRCDLLFQSTMEDEHKFKYVMYYVVELKNRQGKPEDLGQLSRYINGINIVAEKADRINEISARGVLICTGVDANLGDILIAEILADKIRVVNLEVKCNFRCMDMSYKDEYCEQCTDSNQFYNLITKEEGE